MAPSRPICPVKHRRIRNTQVNDPNKAAADFARAFGEAEYAMKRSGILRQNREVAQADWDALAQDLGEDFFSAVVKMGIAKTLVSIPPRRLKSDLQWAPKVPVPITNVHELIVQGVCRVRNSYLHGEKFTGGPDGQWARDIKLIEEAHAVLDVAMDWWSRAKD